ncbi:MAG TPA: 1-acyl-sn-glycerol-3-phosphate acyltransferase [Vicinamibacterales bacterium]
MPLQDEITQAVLAREEVARYLQGTANETGAQARERIHAYLDELRTTQRYAIYKALKHPLYPILRKVERVSEGASHVIDATSRARVVYISNHKSHLDYLVEPLALEDHQIRPPVIAAGINLFGGPLGLIHRHVTGAIPIRRNTKDPAYLVTLKAYVAEILRRHDLFFYIEGGRSYTGEFKPPKTGLLHATLQAEIDELLIVPVAVAYDLVLEDRTLSRQRVKKRQRPFSIELAEMVGSAVGFHTRAFITFGEPVSAEGFDHHSRRDVLELAHLVRGRIGLLHKVLPTALVAAAMRPSSSEADLCSRIGDLIARLDERGANLDVRDPREATASGLELLIDRGAIVAEGDRYRVRDRILLRYYAHSIDHLLEPPRRAASHAH